MVHRGFISTVIVSGMAEKGEQAADEKKGRRPWTLREFGGKTVWEWLQLLVVPAMLALITVVFTWRQNVHQNDLEEQRARQAQKIETQRATAEQALAEQRAQEEAVQAYLDQMSMLLLEKDLRSSDQDSEVRTLARARTLTVLRRLDLSRKTEVMMFLDEAKLISSVDGRDPIVGLKYAALEGAVLNLADLSGANLYSADMHGGILNLTDLSGADVGNANLSDADLSDADLSNADLSWADLSNADLGDADLSGADLSFADLSDATVNNEQLAEARSLEGTTMPDGKTIKSAVNLDGPTFEEWLKSKGSGKKK